MPLDTTPHECLPPSVRPFLVIGSIAVVGGGLVAAVTGPTDWSHGSWVAAFLVLVVGVGQIGLAAGQSLAAGGSPTTRTVVAEVVLLNSGSMLVVAGTLLAMPSIVTAGGLAFLAALVVFARTARAADGGRNWLARGYVGLLAVLVVSTPVGLALSWVRA